MCEVGTANLLPRVAIEELNDGAAGVVAWPPDAAARQTLPTTVAAFDKELGVYRATSTWWPRPWRRPMSRRRSGAC